MALLDLQGMELPPRGHGGGNNPPLSLLSVYFCDFRSDLSLVLCS